MLCAAAVCMAITSPIAASLADRIGRKPVLLAASALAAIVGLLLAPLLSAARSRR